MFKYHPDQLALTFDKQKRYDEAHMEAASSYSKLSYARRSKVGALLVSPNNRPLCCGFNGTSPGTDNNCEVEVDCEFCKGGGRIQVCAGKQCADIPCGHCNGTGKILKTKPDVHHAERNLLGYANRYGIPTDGCTIYVTLSPCVECAKQMEVAGIKRVVYKEAYRDLSGVEYLLSRGIECGQINKE